MSEAGSQIPVKVKELVWSENLPPSTAIAYDHAVAETQFGRYLITWKGWKDQPMPTLDEAPGGFFYCGSDVDEVKAAAQSDFARRILASLE